MVPDLCNLKIPSSWREKGGEVKILKRLGLLLAAAFVLTLVARPPAYEDFVADVETRQLQESGRCPLSKEELEDAAPEAVVLCVNYGLLAYYDAERNLENAGRVYDLLGAVAELHEARRLYGPKVIAVIDRYYTEGSLAAEAATATGAVVADIFEQLRTDPLSLRMPERPEQMSPEDLAVYALQAILSDGEVFLAQFEWEDDGSVARKPIESVAQNAYSVLMGGVRKLERKAITGQELTTYDYGGAALDVAVVFAGVTVLKKAVAGKTVAAAKGVKATKMAKLTTATAKVVKATTATAKVGALGAAGVLAYVAITDPLSLATGVASAGSWVAEFAGLPGWLGEGAAWFLLLLFLWGLSWPVRWLLGLLPWRLALRRRQDAHSRRA